MALRGSIGMTATAVRRCEATIRWWPGTWRSEPVACGQSVGVTPVIDATGTVRGACSREGHRANVIRRFGQEPSKCCGAGGSTPHWVGCPQHPKAMRPTRCRPDELVEMYGR